MAASYPGAIKSFVSKTDLIDVIEAAHVNAAQDEITAIETALGINPYRYVQLAVVGFATACATGDGQYYFHVPASLNGADLIEVHAVTITAGSGGTMGIQVHLMDAGQNMLSTGLTIDPGETGSDTAAIPAVINGTYDNVLENYMIRIDIDEVHSTAALGLIVTLGFKHS